MTIVLSKEQTTLLLGQLHMEIRYGINSEQQRKDLEKIYKTIEKQAINQIIEEEQALQPK